LQSKGLFIQRKNKMNNLIIERIMNDILLVPQLCWQSLLA